MNTMIWSRLKNYKCPTCNRILGLDEGEISCPKKHFEVDLKKFEEMVNYLYRKRKAPNDWERFCKVRPVILNTT